MSGGSMNYLFSKLEYEADFETDTPERIASMSDKARTLYLDARVYVDRINQDHYEGFIPHDVAASLFKKRLCERAYVYAQEATAPWQQAQVKLHMMGAQESPEVNSYVEQVHRQWADAAGEALGGVMLG